MQTHEIRRRFLDHFERSGHTVVPSGSLISEDPTVLFTIAGMAPFKPYFTGQATPPFDRATSVQKCVRTLDIDNVGITTRHNTFFQMAGNFSFGDYFKAGAIEHAWQLVTRSQDDGGYGFDPERLWVTVYETDDEAFQLWQEVAGLPVERIQRLGMVANYWSMGTAGPCGPDSEIFYDRGPEFGPAGGPAVSDDRYIEFWNLVFMQEMRGASDADGNFEILGPLPHKNIDTGLGIERVAFLLQGVDNVYETDLLRPIINTAEQLSGRSYGTDHNDDVRFRVIADHIRSGTMLIGDGVTPGNEGRGYVLRRLLRRTIRATQLLGVTEPVMPTLTAVVRDLMSESYPELTADYQRIERIAEAEEQTFLKTLASGTKLFESRASEARSTKGKLGYMVGLEAKVTGVTETGTIPADAAFALHDTYGFPIDLTMEMASEAGLTVDTDGFARLMGEQKARARADAKARKGGFGDLTVYRDLLDSGGPTEFTGYHELQSQGSVRGVIADGKRVSAAIAGDIVEVVLDRTPLYAESGGQESDAGVIHGPNAAADVLDVQKVNRKLWVHQVRITDGELHEGESVIAKVDPEWRTGARQAHSGTHVVHAALRQVLGPDALQAGSYNKPGYLRLDFSWNSSLSGATRSEIEEVANLAVRKDLPVAVEYTSLQQARQMGALALFGETYDTQVRVVEIGGPWSIELCGGTHVEHSSQIGPVSLIGESSVGSGVRRLEAYVGMEAFRQLATERALVAELAGMLKVPAAEVPGRVEQLVERLRVAEKELDKVRGAAVLASAAALADGAEQVGETAVVAAAAPDGLSASELRTLASDVQHRLGGKQGVVALFAPVGNGVSFVVACTQAAVDGGRKAGELVRSFLPDIDGRGGGRPELAQGGGSNAAGIPAAVASLKAAIG